jgi:hypothetical protein
MRRKVAVLRRQVARPRVDRAVLAGLAWLLPGPAWRGLFVQPATSGHRDRGAALVGLAVLSSGRNRSGPVGPTVGELGHTRSPGKELSLVPLRPERVVEVRCDHLGGRRFRHTAHFVRWRPDRDPRSCCYAQLEETVGYDLAEVLATTST